MRPILPAGVMLALAGGAAFAQAPAPSADPAAPSEHAPTGVKPVDHGPYTPEANRAYQGGGVVLEGQPGGPAPKPEPTPPGQAPRDAVPR